MSNPDSSRSVHPDVYNAYELTSQLGALYAVAFSGQLGISDREMPEPLVSILADVGVLFRLAEDYINNIKGHATSLHESEGGLVQRVERLRKLNHRLNQWTSNRRWLRILRACETTWINTLNELRSSCPRTDGVWEELKGNAASRISWLKAMQEDLSALYDGRQARYAEPMPL